MTPSKQQWQIYAWNGSAWVNIKADVQGVSGSWGINGNKPFDLMASTGTFKFTLINQANNYTPGHGSAYAWWKKGTIILFRAEMGTSYVNKFYGRIDDLGITPGFTVSFVQPTCVDWLDFAAKYTLQLPASQANKRADQALATIVASMPIAPLTGAYDVGVETFPTVFDTTTGSTTAMSEITKLVLSEAGRVYIKKSQPGYGEQLIFENNQARNGLRTLTEYPAGADVAGYLLQEDGSKILLEDGSGYLKLDELSTLHLNGDITAASVSYGDMTLNNIKVAVHPKVVNLTDIVVLYKIGSALSIASGETKTVTGTFSNPTGGGKANGINMIAPAITTDYKMWTAADGTGTDLTADLTIVATYGSAGVSYVLTNTSTYAGYITTLQARGYGVYPGDPLEYTASSSASQTEFGFEGVKLDQPYQQDLLLGTRIADRLLLQEKTPRTVLNSISSIANKNQDLMSAFIHLDIGDLISVTIAQMGINARWCYIQNVSFTAGVNEVIYFTWGLQEAFLPFHGLTPLAVEFANGHAGGTSTDGITFGVLPDVTNNLSAFTIAAWIRPHSPAGDPNQYTIAGNYNGEMGWWCGIDQDDKYLFFGQQGTRGATRGYWRTAFNSITLDANSQITITRDATNPANAPVMYINGTSMAVTEVTAQSGATGDDTGMPFCIGNLIYTGFNFPFDGLINSFRIYNRVLSGTEVSTISAESPLYMTTVTSGLVFWGLYAYDWDYVDYVGAVLTNEDSLLEGVYGEVGKIHGTPIARAI